MAINNFDPLKYGAKPVQQGFNPQQYGATALGSNGMPLREPESVKQSFMSRLGGIAKSVGNALTSSEQTLGRGLSTVFDKNTQNTVGEINRQEQSGQQSIIDAIRKESDPVKKQRLTEFLKTHYKTDYQTPTAGDINPAFDLSNKQVIGAAAGTALDIATAGSLNKGAQSFKALKAADQTTKVVKAAEAFKLLSNGEKAVKIIKSTAKASAIGAGLGYGYDVSNKLKDDESVKEAIKPGWGTALGAAIPAVFGATKLSKIGANELGARIDNSLIKPLPKDFRYGKNPGRTIAEMGITANSQDGLVTKLRLAKQKVGEELGQTAQTLESQINQVNPVAIDLSKSLSPLDDAIKQAVTNNDQTLLNRINQVKTALTQKLEATIDDKGNTIIQSVGERPLQGGFANALELKRLVGSLTKWTGNPSEDKLINKALKQVYSGIDEQMLSVAKTASPELATQFEKLNSRYADLLTGEIAARHTYELTQRQNLVSLPIKVGTATGVITAIATGGASIPAVLAGVGAGVLEKALGSTAVKTRVASWLAKESPTVLESLVQKNPKLRDVLYKVFIKENKSVDKAVLAKLQSIKTDGIPVGLSIKSVKTKAPSEITKAGVDTGSSFYNRLNKYETEALKKAKAQSKKANKK